MLNKVLLELYFLFNQKNKHMILKITIFWIICFCIDLGWNLQQNRKEIKFSNIVINLIFGPFLLLTSIGAILRCIYEYLIKITKV